MHNTFLGQFTWDSSYRTHKMVDTAATYGSLYARLAAVCATQKSTPFCCSGTK